MIRHLVVLVYAGILCAGTLHAQTVTGRISGAVRDASNAVVPGATVSVIHEGTQIVRTARADDAGFYVVTNLPPGDYSVAVEHRGFKTFVASGNVLVADGRLTVDATLETGAVTETVTVTAEAGETVNTTSGEIARVVDGDQAQSLALNGRNFLQLPRGGCSSRPTSSTCSTTRTS